VCFYGNKNFYLELKFQKDKIEEIKVGKKRINQMEKDVSRLFVELDEISK